MPFERSSSSRVALVVLAMAGLSACQSGGQQTAAAAQTAPPAEATIDELRAFCPRVEIRSDGAVASRYQSGGDGDPTRLIQRTTIADATRACSYGAGTITLNVAVAGRVVPGPIGGAGTVTVPVVFEARRGGDVLYSNQVAQQVQVAGSAAQFIVSDAAVTIPQDAARQTRIVVRLAQ